MSEKFKTRLTEFLDAAYPVLGIETFEESRVLTDIREIATSRAQKDKEFRYYEWDEASGLSRIVLVDETEDLKTGNVEGYTPAERQPNNALGKVVALCEPSRGRTGQINKYKPAILVMKDIHPHLEKSGLWRAIRNEIGKVKEFGICLVFLCARMKVPAELSKEVQLLDYDLPNREALEGHFGRYVEVNLANVKVKNLPAGFVRSVAEASMGMTEAEADNAFALATINSARRNEGKMVFDQPFVKTIFEVKISNLRSSALEYLPTHAGFESVGGLENVKQWAIRRREGFSEKARALRLSYPKGVLLAGMKGCGKTMTAMAIAHQFEFPLFKFDVTKLYAGRVGESEALVRDVIRLLESLGRCAVLIDELEKFFSTDATSGGGDSGVSSRMFGTLVSWMALKTCPVFIIGTLNNFDRLPPELTRKGRFDEVFFVDLPSPGEREAIFNALIKYKFKATAFENCVTPDLITRTDDFSGAEIEAVIEEALYDLLGNPQAKGTDLLMNAAASIKPQATIEPELVARLRKKSEGFKQASLAKETHPVQAQANTGRRKVNLN